MTIIAIDGPAAAGKGTLARSLAGHYGFAYLDTGALYRAVALAALDADADLDDAETLGDIALGLDLSYIDDGRLRREVTGKTASAISRFSPVRAALLDIQRGFASNPPALASGRDAKGAILDGRDIGTVICPGADVKLFVTASAEARAQRRLRDEQARGHSPDLDSLIADIKARDAADASRAEAPLRPADDAHLLDTTDLRIEATFEQAVAVIDAALNQDGTRTGS